MTLLANQKTTGGVNHSTVVSVWNPVLETKIYESAPDRIVPEMENDKFRIDHSFYQIVYLI